MGREAAASAGLASRAVILRLIDAGSAARKNCSLPLKRRSCAVGDRLAGGRLVKCPSARLAGAPCRDTAAVRRAVLGAIRMDGLFLGRPAVDRLAVDPVLALPLGGCADAADVMAAASPASAASAARFGFGLGVAMGALFLVDQRLPIGDGDLIVVGMDFAEGEEAVAVPAVADEGGLERGLHARDLGEIDVPAKLLAVSADSKSNSSDSISTHHDTPGFPPDGSRR